MTAKVDDVRKTITSDFKAGDVVYQLGETYKMGASELYGVWSIGANVPGSGKKKRKTYIRNVQRHIKRA